MDLAGTAVGIISLGLQVCQGIVSYSQAWRGYDEEIQNARNKAQALRMPLKTLRETVEELQQTRPEVAADLEEQVMSMQSSIEKLKKVVDRFKPAQSEAFPDKVRAQLKKGVYYFQKDTLQDVQNHLDQIQNVLQTSLLIYNWQDTRESRAMQISIYEEMQSMHSILKMAISSTGMPPPSLLQLACDSQNKQPPMMVSDSGPLAQTDLGDYNNRLLYQRQVWIRAQSKRVTRAYTYHNRFLNFAISASFSMIRGAGGLSIAPNLQIQSVWGWGSERYGEMIKITQDCRRNGLVIPTLLRAFSEQRLSPYDTFYYLANDEIASLMDVICLEAYGLFHEKGDLQTLFETVKFMLDCGMKPKNAEDWIQNPLLYICAKAILKMEDLPLILNLIEVTGPLQLNHPRHVLEIPPYYVNLKHNLRLVLSQDEELIRATKIAKAIIRESEKELREALTSGNSPNDRIGFLSPLELAFGWPKGTQILLQLGANPHSHFPSLAVAEGEEYHVSAALVLEAGCVIEVVDFVRNELCNDGGKTYSLLVDHLAARRRRLCTLAESSLPLDQIPSLDGPPANIYGALAAKGIDVPIALRFGANSLGSMGVYQTSLAYQSRDFTKVMDTMYEIGFHDVDFPDQYGITPLMGFNDFCQAEPSVIIKCAAWLMSRGACVERKLPTSNAKVAHLLTSQVIYQYLDDLEFLGELDSREKKYRDWKKGIAELEDACFFVSSTKDCCVCACSSGGCTTLSVALRSILLEVSKGRWIIMHIPLRKLILSLIVWQDYWPDLPRAIVRILTFDALGLTHTCCTEIYSQPLGPGVPEERRDETEVGSIADDQHSLVEEFEELMEEMESKLDELSLPLEEFLDGYWYDRVIEHLSRRDRYDEEHVTEARKMGIFLEPEEFCIPDRVSLQFRSPVQELQDDLLLDEPK